MQKDNQTDKDRGSEYPEPFESGWMDIGSRTIDSGMHFTLKVDDSGFHLRKDIGTRSVSDLFGEIGWWPTYIAWEGQNANLLGLLDDLAPKVGVAATTLLDIVREHLEEYGGDADIEAYLSDERSNALSLESLRSRHARLFGDFRIPGLPSDDLKGEGTCYRGLELVFGPGGWSATLWEPDENDELFHPDCWDGDTLDDVMNDSLPWTRDEFVEVLVEADPCWEHFIDKDFST
jgi:hypothetical protein